MRVTKILFFLFFLFFSVAGAFAQPQRSMWVWNSGIAAKPYHYFRLFEFCRENNIDLIFFNAQNLNNPPANIYRQFIRSAHLRNIKVYALAGDPRWGKEEYHSLAINWIDQILAFNKSGLPQEKFDGILADIEIYLLKDLWDGEKSALLAEFLNLFSKMDKKIKDKKEKIELGLSIPFWFDEPSLKIEHNDAFAEMSFHILDMADFVMLLDFRNFSQGPNGSIELAQREINYAQKLNKKVYIGQETEKSLESDYISFSEQPIEYMEKELKKLADYYNPYSSFAGVAIHHYGSYQKMFSKNRE